MVGSKTAGAAPQAPPPGVATEQSPKSDFTFEKLHGLLEPILLQIERAVLAKASSYTDAHIAREAQKADRAHLMAALNEIRSEPQQVTPQSTHPTEGMYIGEADIEKVYRSKFVANGLFMLPNVVQAIGPDASGNVIVTVEYALADKEGRLWPAAVRVCGMGNDRVASQRGGTGDKAMPRALSAAYVEAVCRLMGVAIERHDAEQHDKAHEALPAPAARPSNERRPTLSLADEDAFRERMMGTLANLKTAAEVDRLLERDDVKAKMKLVSTRTRTLIEKEAAECKRRLRSDDRGGGRREGEGRQEPEGRGRSYADDMGGGQSYNDPDDDIPF